MTNSGPWGGWGYTGAISFIFVQLSAKIWLTPLWEIMNPPLMVIEINVKTRINTLIFSNMD